MSGTFDERGKGSDSPGKRPAPTIEGTATEVSVAPADDAAQTAKTKISETKTPETKTSETKTGESETASAESGVAASAEDKTAETETAEHKPGEVGDAGAEQGDAADPSAEKSGSEKPGSDESVSGEPGSEDPRPDKTTSEAASGDGSETGPWQDAARDTGPDAEPVVHIPRAGSEPQDRSFGGRFLGWLAALFTHALAGVAGGLAVLTALIWGYLPTLPSQERAGAERIESGIESRIAALESASKSPDNTVALENAATLRELKAQLAALESAAEEPTTPSVDPAELKALSAQVAQLETALKSLAETAKEGGSVADAAVISQEVAEAERRLDARLKSQLQSKVQAEVQSALADQPDTPANDEAVQALKSEMSGLDAKLKALTEATMDADGAAKLQPEISALQRRVGDIETTVPSLLDAIDADNAQVRQAHLAIAFSGLREAVNAGQPYATELTAMTALSPNPEDIGDLVAYEDTGIPTTQMLAASFVPLRDKVLAEQPGAAQDVVGRLLGSAQSLVTIRRIGEQAEGLGPDAILARADAKLEAGKLREAVTELQELQGAPADVFKSWIGQARARLDADTALQRLQDVLLVSLAGSGGASEEPGAPAAKPEARAPESGAPAAREETE